MSDPDTEEMLRFQAGDERAFERIVVRFLRPLAAFFRRLGADASLAEDCASETLYKLYRSRASYEPRARLSTFLFAVARHHWIDVVRHRSLGPATVSLDAPEPGGEESSRADRLPGREGVPTPPTDAAALGRALREAVAALPPEHREVFALAQSESLTYAEIGEVLSISVGTVKSRMHADVRLLRERLSRGGFEP